MSNDVSAPGGRQSGEVPPGSGRVAVAPSWGDLDAAIERVRSVAAGAKARAEEAAAQTGHPVDVLAGIRAADALLICDALAEASRRNVRDEDIIMRQFMELQKLREGRAVFGGQPHVVELAPDGDLVLAWRIAGEVFEVSVGAHRVRAALEEPARGCADCGKPTPVYCRSCNFARMGGY